MKSRKPGSTGKNQAALILEVLADKMPDQTLQEYFADLSPQQVRNFLQKTAETIAPPQKGRSKAASQPTLWQSGEKSWKGKLAGQTVQLYTDGASRGNPGEAGTGVVILDEQGDELVATGKYLGQCTNNEAEYRALLYGLEKCAELGSGRLKVHLDSELIVKQIRGEYKVKHPNLKPLFQQAMVKLSGFASYSVSHVRREKNRRADELANRAIDEREK